MGMWTRRGRAGGRVCSFRGACNTFWKLQDCSGISPLGKARSRNFREQGWRPHGAHCLCGRSTGAGVPQRTAQRSYLEEAALESVSGP